jgi:hypothetical protein
VDIDRTQGEASGSSLHLASESVGGAAAPVVWIRSEPIEPPTTGRLSLIASIRVADPARQPMLRLAIEGKLGGQIYYMKANVGATEDGREVNPLTAEWSRYRFPLNSLPLAGLSDLRVGFDLMGAGEVWIDNVQIYDLYFEKPELNELRLRIALATQSLADRQEAECRMFVDGYWPGFLRRHVPLVELRPSGAGELARSQAASGPNSARPAGPPKSPAAPPAAMPPPPRSAEKKSWWPDWMSWR